VNNERFNYIMAVLGRYELTLLENQFVGRVKEYCEKNGMITERFFWRGKMVLAGD